MPSPDISSGLRLYSSGLLSRWGFNDGDTPEAFYDYCEDHEIDYGAIDWGHTLVKLVREFLLPAIEQDIEVHEIETSHNPIRARCVGGVEVAFPVDDTIKLTPEYVEVSWATVVEMAVSR